MFNFDFFRQQILSDTIMREDKIKESLQEVEINRQIVINFSNFINHAKQIMNRIEKDYVLIPINGLKLVYADDIYIIDEISRQLDEERQSLNINDIKQMLIYCIGCISTTIRNEVGQRQNDRREPSGLEARIQHKLGNGGNVLRYINNIKIKRSIIVDISHQLLIDEVLQNKVKSSVSAEYKELIDRYIEINNRINN